MFIIYIYSIISILISHRILRESHLLVALQKIFNECVKNSQKLGRKKSEINFLNKPINCQCNYGRDNY